MSITTIPAPQSVERMFAVLDRLSYVAEEGATLTELARAIGAPKTSLMSLLSGMVASGHVTKDDAGSYRLGARMFSLSIRIASSLDVLALARPILEALMTQTGESVFLGALAPSGDRAMYIEKFESPSPLRYTAPLGEQRDLYCSAIGKLLLAYMPPHRQDEYLSTHELRAFTATTITSRKDLMDQLQEIRARGFARTAGERIAGADAIAAPVFGFGGDVIAAVVVVGPSERMRASLEGHTEKLLDSASLVSQSMASADRLRPAA